MSPHRRYPQVPLLALTGTPNFTFFCKPLLLNRISPWEMTIKHSMYTPTVPFLSTERACVVFFPVPRKIFSVQRSEASIMDGPEGVVG